MSIGVPCVCASGIVPGRTCAMHKAKKTDVRPPLVKPQNCYFVTERKTHRHTLYCQGTHRCVTTGNKSRCCEAVRPLLAELPARAVQAASTRALLAPQRAIHCPCESR
jgi:hypothetical protein